MPLRHLIEYLLLATIIGGPYAPLHLPPPFTPPSIHNPLLPPYLKGDVGLRGGADGALTVEVSAASAIVVDAASGKTLFVKNADEPRPIASIAKLMSVMIALERIPDLDQKIVITEQDRGGGEGTIFEVGDSLTARELIFASLVASVNDAVRALVRSIGLSEAEFVKLMNLRARELQMFATKFIEPTGLDPGNQSTARNLILLLRAAAQAPLIREATTTIIFRTSGSTPKSQYLINTNLLLPKLVHEVVVGKTGSLDEAGYCLGSLIRRNGRGVLIVVLGSENHWSRFSDVETLTNWTFFNWQWN